MRFYHLYFLIRTALFQNTLSLLLPSLGLKPNGTHMLEKQESRKPLEHLSNKLQTLMR